MIKKMTIENAREVKAFFSKQLEKKKSSIDLGRIESLDLSGVQMILGFIKTADEAGFPLEFRGVLSDEAGGVLSDGGFVPEGVRGGESVLDALRRAYAG